MAECLEGARHEHLSSRNLPGLRLTKSWGNSTDTSKFDLSLYLHESGAGFSGYFEYATDLFDRGTIERLGRHLHTLLQGPSAALSAGLRRAALPALCRYSERGVSAVGRQAEGARQHPLRQRRAGDAVGALMTSECYTAARAGEASSPCGSSRHLFAVQVRKGIGFRVWLDPLPLPSVVPRTQ